MSALGQALALVPVLLAGLLITGLVVRRSSPDPGLALRAMLIGIMVPPLVGVLALVLPGVLGSDQADAIVLNLAGAALIGLLVYIPVGLGFGIGRLVWPSPKDQA